MGNRMEKREENVALTFRNRFKRREIAKYNVIIFDFLYL